jgi:hypothetical protein
MVSARLTIAEIHLIHVLSSSVIDVLVPRQGKRRELHVDHVERTENIAPPNKRRPPPPAVAIR